MRRVSRFRAWLASEWPWRCAAVAMCCAGIMVAWSGDPEYASRLLVVLGAFAWIYAAPSARRSSESGALRLASWGILVAVLAVALDALTSWFMMSEIGSGSELNPIMRALFDAPGAGTAAAFASADMAAGLLSASAPALAGLAVVLLARRGLWPGREVAVGFASVFASLTWSLGFSRLCLGAASNLAGIAMALYGGGAFLLVGVLLIGEAVMLTWALWSGAAPPESPAGPGLAGVTRGPGEPAPGERARPCVMEKPDAEHRSHKRGERAKPEVPIVEPNWSGHIRPRQHADDEVPPDEEAWAELDSGAFSAAAHGRGGRVLPWRS